MSGIMDSLRGIYHFMTDMTPPGLTTVPPRRRRPVIWQQDDRPLVSRLQAEPDLEASIARSLGLLGGLGKLATAGETIMVKPNFNSPDPYPGSTDLDFLSAVVRLLLQTGARVVVGESSGGIWRPTRNTLARLGVPELLSGLGVELIAFEDSPRDWVEVEIPGDYLKKATVPRSAYEASKLVYLPCLKTHNLARFSLSLKLAVGLLHPGQRRSLHWKNLEQKAAEINLALQPDLVIMDGRKAFVTGGPAKGKLVEPGVILASGDMVATDVEALEILLSYGARNRLLPDPWASPQIVTALRHGLGSGKGGYRVIVE